MPRKSSACTECQRRRQKCIVKRNDEICTNCAKRFPPVDCTRSVKLPDIVPVSNSFPPPWNWRDWMQTVPSDTALAGSCPIAEVDEHEKAVAILRRTSNNLILDGRGDQNALRPFGGIIMEVNTLNGSPLPNTPRNIELLHFYLRFVTPNLTSIDGESQPEVFCRDILSWQLQSPLFPNIAILMACTTQSLDQGTELDRNREFLSMKSRVLSYINKFLTGAETRNFPPIAAEAMKCVINLMVTEWFWGADDSMWAHERGIREMLRLVGGMKALNDPTAEGVIILTDYEVSCCFEQDLHWQGGNPIQIPVPQTWPRGFDSPLIPSAVTFDSNQEVLGINSAAASILDDIRFLTVSIAWTPKLPPESSSKIRSTATWLHEKLEKMNNSKGESSERSEADMILEVIQIAGLIYTWSIMSITPSSQYPKTVVKDELYSAMRSVSLTRWKRTPGLFLWIMLVLCPGTINNQRGRFIRRKMAVAGLSIGFEDFPLGISLLRAFWLVQRWVASHEEPSRTESEIIGEVEV